ncbi:phosphate signaling complex protein PhoU [Lactobacillus sp. LC28-10]|uniref:Phosphate-specific transport system accessory protein PhoU n=1 Tax=Secundilactobacillus angelensis TaxID=2722706 RepID=A0ABX1KXR4_9LACO|nr:phosphate signaling complex protein PhoU [Secundilactobacillus angelensis]MCH5462493.1 phosphate signaling complex protein PhoU [Secundilactobacillus angelensis]NLR18025.1 phosphate signaling complex protein PhoU [Secundilactobacillus angelensis]
MNNIFTTELKKLFSVFTEMGEAVSAQIEQATESYISHDKAAAQSLVQQDNSINTNEVDLEKQALTLMTLQQPVADDFRHVITILKASSDLERIGDHATGIALETIRVKGSQRNKDVETDIAALTVMIRTMLKEALAALQSFDMQSAQAVANQDQDVDAKFDQIRRDITAAIQVDPSVAEAGASYLMVTKLLERIGDRIVNLAEEMVYNQTGEIVELNQGRLHPNG